MKWTLFLVFSGAILIFTLISICCAPIINGDIIDADLILNNINEQNKESTFEKLKRIQLLLKKESSLISYYN